MIVPRCLIHLSADNRMLRQLQLWDADGVEHGWSVRHSRRARRPSVRVFRHGGVEIVVPPRTLAARVSAFVVEHREWIERQRSAGAADAVAVSTRACSASAAGEKWRAAIVAEWSLALREQCATEGGLELQLDGDLQERERLRESLRALAAGARPAAAREPAGALARTMGVVPGTCRCAASARAGAAVRAAAPSA